MSPDASNERRVRGKPAALKSGGQGREDIMAVLNRSPRRGATRLLALALLSAVAFGTVAAALAQGPRKGTDEVIAVREFELRAGVDLAAFERFVTETYNPGWADVVPGVRGYIAKGDRGAHKGRYAFILIFDSQKVRDDIFPKESEGAAERFAPMLERALALNAQLDKFIEPASFSIYTDYVPLR
jgi:hypothetical protein